MSKKTEQPGEVVIPAGLPRPPARPETDLRAIVERALGT